MIATSVASLLATTTSGAAAADPAWWRFAIIPFVAAVIGWGTNWLAIKMTFLPLEFVGIPPYLGWQGIIPNRSKKMASISMDKMMGNLASLEDIIQEMEPDAVAQHVLRWLRPELPRLLDEIAGPRYGPVWDRTPQAVREVIAERTFALLTRNVTRIQHDLAAHADQLIDLRMMVIELLSENKALLNRVFQEAGRQEFRFLVNSGAYFGFALGIVQMLVFLPFSDATWVLPAFGLFVGYATNWLALKLIFEPTEPRRVGPFTLLGQFLKRRGEIAAYMSTVVANELITIDTLIERMLTGPQADRAEAMFLHHIAPMLDEAMGIARPAIELGLGQQHLDELKRSLVQQAQQLTLVPMSDPAFIASRAELIQREMERRMNALSNDEFSGILRPVVEEDEWKLIAVGAVLGGLAGLAQAALTFS